MASHNPLRLHYLAKKLLGRDIVTQQGDTLIPTFQALGEESPERPDMKLMLRVTEKRSRLTAGIFLLRSANSS
ncbi:unnamed protein product [Tetraodon nigroviridis]|uniref:(spotted green pufferfish) hypothetical protein n=1 Tax=Tetraodon nigroviridis TaxID=99883 RepID=Q4RPJ9_TETNG|nr:unnamed protein product [Tetraodon nigroviridis]